MGIRFRKSINLGGGFRINLSKSGIGYSWGINGYRITKTASGKTRRTYSIPGTGISYVSEDDKKRFPQSHYNTPNSSPSINNVNNYSEIASATINNFQSAEYSSFLHQLSLILRIDKLANFLSFFIIFIVIQSPIYIIGLVGFLLKIITRLFAHVNLEYEMDEYYMQKYSERIDAWTELNKSWALWQVLGAGNVINKKVEAGASRSITRKAIRLQTKIPFFLKTNVKIIVLKLKKETLLLLPDKVFIIRGTKVGAEEYDNLTINISSVKFIEDQIVPKDAIILYYTWQYVNKNGSPDKRYKNNRQLPVCRYGGISIKSLSGINVELQCSCFQMAENLGLKIKQ